MDAVIGVLSILGIILIECAVIGGYGFGPGSEEPEDEVTEAVML